VKLHEKEGLGRNQWFCIELARGMLWCTWAFQIGLWINVKDLFACTDLSLRSVMKPRSRMVWAFFKAKNACLLNLEQLIFKGNHKNTCDYYLKESRLRTL